MPNAVSPSFCSDDRLSGESAGLSRNLFCLFILLSWYNFIFCMFSCLGLDESFFLRKPSFLLQRRQIEWFRAVLHQFCFF
ncbi:hypothetical protein MUK42_16299 [Musa troglodytarum]|uniref:Uncharacterized protein n=1 Tax=Musa troglodytarum TaxID=320322 RepID=A0A9E7KCF8_9LILI|nr:hypothetical protein MUK42_16299 [Musa troglodytarum]